MKTSRENDKEDDIESDDDDERHKDQSSEHCSKTEGLQRGIPGEGVGAHSYTKLRNL